MSSSVAIAVAACGGGESPPGQTGTAGGDGGAAGKPNTTTGGSAGKGNGMAGNAATAGSTATGGGSAMAGAPGSGGFGPKGGASMGGGAGTTSGSAGTVAAGGMGGGMMGGAGAGAAAGGMGVAGGSGGGDCTFTINAMKSSKMETVAVVDWSTTLASPTSAQIVYTLNGAGANVLNKGGTAPVDVSTGPSFKTLLVGLKPSSTYTFHVEATGASGTCKSPDQTVMTGTLSGAPTIMRTATNPSAQAVGFIISGGDVKTSPPVFIVDADGTVVWSAAAPTNSSRARLDYEGKYMWMMALNVGNTGGEMRYMTLDGQTSMNNVSGLSKAHHDFTVLPGGIIATMSWSASGSDPESDLIERSPDGSVKTAVHIGPNLYAGGPSVFPNASANSYHANSIAYHKTDDSYTIGDRNPNTYVKVSRSGTLQWQFGGSCSGAKTQACAAGTWNVNHGHHLLDDGTFLLFSNGEFQNSQDPSAAYEFKLTATASSLMATQVKKYTSSGNDHSDSLGDVQRLKNGNTLVTFSNTGKIEELDPSWNVVQTLKASGLGYAEWRETLYGPPPR